MIIPVNKPIFNGNEKKYLLDCIETGWISSAGEYVKRFENTMAEYIGVAHGVSVTNGTSALETAVMSLNLEKNSEVIIPDFTIISCAGAIVKAGLVPVPVDCTPDTWNMDVEKIEESITPKTRAIMVVHIYGLPVDMDVVISLAQKHNLYIIEDAAEAHGLEYKGKKCGSFGYVSAFSFFSNKNITSGEGGMVLTNNDEIYENALRIRNLFFDNERKYIHEDFGSNFRMTNLQAAVGLAQLEQINKTIIRKKEIGIFYQELLCDIDVLQLPCSNTYYAENNYWVFGIVIKNNTISADKVMKKLLEKGVDTRHFFYPIHKQPALINKKCCKRDMIDDKKFAVSNYISEYGFYLPSGVGITLEEQKYVSDTLHQILC